MIQSPSTPAVDSPSAGSAESSESSARSAGQPDQLTVLVFKDNSTPRTFRVPLRWISQFGSLLAAISIASVICLALGVKVLTSRSRIFNDVYVNLGSQNRVHELEGQLKEAQDQLQTLKSTTIANSSSGSSSAISPGATNPDTGVPVIDPSLLSPSTPIESRPFLFKALPDQIKSPPEEVPIILGSPSARWNGKSLTVKFNLQYVSKVPGGQQGRIVILARGPGMILTHPTEIFQAVGKDVLIDPNKGEYFSVSRYREARADFGPVQSRDAIKEVEVIILSSAGQMLIHQKIVPGEIASASKRVSAPKDPSSGAEAPESPESADTESDSGATE